MKIRITGLPEEVESAVEIFAKLAMFQVLEVSDPYPNRGNSRMVRVYIDAQFTEWTARSWLGDDCAEGPFKERMALYQPGQLPHRRNKQIP
jgi:hypothetical protein